MLGSIRLLNRSVPPLLALLTVDSVTGVSPLVPTQSLENAPVSGSTASGYFGHRLGWLCSIGKLLDGFLTVGLCEILAWRLRLPTEMGELVILIIFLRSHAFQVDSPIYTIFP